MKDLSKLDIPKKQKKDIQPKPEKPKLNKKKKLLIIAIICLLSVAIVSKLINKIKAEEKAKIEQQIDKKETTKNTKQDQKANNNQKPNFSENTPSGKMIFTFYNNLKHDSVSVNVNPEAKRAQYKYTYIYQIASFRNMNETSWYVKKMKKDGLNPQFKRVGNWIRMYIGPYDSKRAMAPDVIKLQRIGLNGGFPREVSRTKIKPKSDKKNSKTSTDEKDNSNKKTQKN
ncbi:cell division protein [Francisella halioticida]|uniref:Cell division protein n=1 Tax=Francisella halioticida TaxID=549298 RepID=A0ABN5B0V0_9GAMM|nr:SPOR domain-containing protein [Francisella halioticida]ASG68077.1 cell division protein [Francisella halioticida]BCD90356.1 cell division protein [Francisella halioticida]